MVGMEAAALSAAITGILKVVGNKLAPLIIKEYSCIVGVKKDLQELQDLVEEINCCLGTARDRATGDAPWLKKLKQVAYDVDDVVDEFQLKAEKHDTDGDGGSVFRYVHIKTESFLLQCKAAKNIKQIKKRFAEIVKQRTDLTAIFGHDPVSHINKTTVNAQTLPVGDEATILGRDQEMHQIISNLVENNDKNEIKIVSIVGLGGSGKTTLAKLIFNDGETIEKQFEVRLWVHVSQEFDFEKLIKKLFEAFADKDPGQPSLPYMSKRIQEGLTRKKFLIVMDDIWTESQNQWDKIMDHLKAGAPGSGILITTRSKHVAKAVRSTYQFCLPRLSSDDSWQLFQQSFRMPVKCLEPGFIEVGKEIVETCCGLPLAIKVLAGSLGDKELIGEWQAMRDNLLDIEGEESVSASLKLSYFHLPSNLKPCFTMCSLFPKGHLINKQQLIDQWIAHDMVSLIPGVDDLEHIGCRYFNSLVQVYFLQDVEEHDGKVTCKMHDVIHDLARSILSEEFSTTLPEDATNSSKGYRYFCLTESPKRILPKQVFDSARAINVDSVNDIIFGKALKNAKHLRSVTVRSACTTRAFSTILQIENLSYLHISSLKCEKLPDAISRIWRLEALHITHSGFLELPQSICKLQKLRTLNLSWCIELKTLPDSIGDCHMISSIDLSFCYELTSLPMSINGNENLRVLRLCNTRIERLTSSITTLGNLEYLDLSCSSLIELPEGIENLRKLKVMNLEGCVKLGSMPKGIHQLVHLQKLGLFALGEGEKCAQLSELANVGKLGGDLTVTGIEQVTEPSDAHMACLKQKTNLQQLSLVWRSGCMDVGNEVAVLNSLEPPSEIKELKIKQYPGRQYPEWMQKQDGLSRFPFLTRMTLSNFPKLKHLKGLVELPCLKDLELIKMLALESISGGPFPSLVYFNMIGLPRLKEVWMVTQQISKCTEERGGSNNQTYNLGQVQIGICLSKLSIDMCAALVVKPHLPLSLEELQLSHTNEQLVQLPGQQDQRFISDTGFTPSVFSFSCLKKLRLCDVKVPTSPVLKKKETASSSPRSVSLYSWELIQHMPALEDLSIECWAGLIELPESIQGLTSLRSLNIQECSCLCTLPEWLGAIRSLECMVIQNCNSLSSLPTSFQQLTTLQRLVLVGCTSLEVPEWLGELRSLKYLWAHCCWGTIPKSLGQLNSLKLLRIEGCDEQHQSWGRLKVCPCDAHHQLPEFMLELHSLRELYIGKLRGMTFLPQSIGCLTSLESLTLENLHALRQLPDFLGGLCSLRKLFLKHLHGLISLPQSMCRLTSLEELYCCNCRSMKFLPEGIRDLTALRYLWINSCPGLGRRCKGEDWHLISHVDRIRIDGQDPRLEKRRLHFPSSSKTKLLDKLYDQDIISRCKEK